MGWRCKCPQCRLADFDFTSGEPAGEEWEHLSGRWRWTPAVENRTGGYRLVVFGSGTFFSGGTLRLADGLYTDFSISSAGTPDGPAFELTLFHDSEYVVATSNVVPPGAQIGGCVFFVCQAYTGLYRSYVLRVLILDSNLSVVASMEAAIPIRNLATLPEMQPPTVEFSDSATFVAIDGMQPDFHGCCTVCMPTGCYRIRSVTSQSATYLVYDAPGVLRLNLSLTGTAAPYAIATFGECCPGNIGTILEVEVDVAANIMAVTWYDCGDYSYSPTAQVVSLQGNFDSQSHDYNIAICVKTYQEAGTTKLVVSAGVSSDAGQAGRATAVLWAPLSFFSRSQCAPEFYGTTDPGDVLNLENAVPVTVLATSSVRPLGSYIDPCGCVPIPGPVGTTLCDRELCPEDGTLQGWVIEVTGLQSDGWSTFNGAYALSDWAGCPAMATTEETSADPVIDNLDDPSDPLYSPLVSWMASAYPGISELPVYCTQGAHYSEAGMLEPNEGRYTYRALCLTLYRIASALPFQSLESVPFAATVSTCAIYLLGEGRRCLVIKRGLYVASVPWPLCPSWNEFTLSRIAIDTQVRCSGDGCPDICDYEPPDPPSSITVVPVTA